jgi:nicotinate-nucleotide adenylyltransferase
MKTGLLFGSFNPIHIGHVAIAGYMKEFEFMDEIWFILSPHNPFKNLSHLVSSTARLEMLNLALADFPAFRASGIELTMPRPSYTINTLEILAEKHPDRDFYLIIGTDNLESIGQWKGGTSLLRDYKFLFYPRPGTDNSNLEKFGNARIVNAPLFEISSSFIRDSILQGKDMRAFVPAGTFEYILKNRLYSGTASSG